MQAYQGYPTGQVEHAAGSWSQVPVAQAYVVPQVQPQRVPAPAAPAAPARALAPSPFDVLQWLVYVEGGEVVGPVSANQVARGVRSGRVPSDASIQAVGEVFWTGILDEPAILAALAAT